MTSVEESEKESKLSWSEGKREFAASERRLQVTICLQSSSPRRGEFNGREARMDSLRHKRKTDISKSLAFIQLSLPYPEPADFKDFLVQLVHNLLEEGSDLITDGDLKEAEKEFSEGLDVSAYALAQGVEIPPVLLESLHVNRAGAHHRLKEYDKAVKDCDEALRLNRESRNALYRKAACLRDMGRLREAYNCATECLLLNRLDKEVNILAQKLAIQLGLKTRKPYISSKVPGSHFGHDSGPPENVSAAASVLPAPPPPAVSPPPASDKTVPSAESDLIGDDLDTLLDCYPAEQTEPGVTSSSFCAPIHVMPTCLPAPSPQLPPAFFPSAVSQLNSLDSPAVGAETTLDALDDLLPSQSLDSLDDFSPISLEAGRFTPAPLEGLDSLDSLCDASPSSKVRGSGEAKDLTVLLSQLGPVEKAPDVELGCMNGGAVHQLDMFDTDVSAGVTTLDTLSDFGPSGVSAIPAAASNTTLNTAAEAKHPLARTHEFLQACVACFPREGQGVHTFVHKPNLVHNCERDILLCRRKSPVPAKWTRIREIPTWTSFTGPFVLCRGFQRSPSESILWRVWFHLSGPSDLIASGDLGLCKYGEDCTFAFSQLEIDVWTAERKGALNRQLLFQLAAPARDPIGNVVRLLQENKGTFIFVCKECFDGKPRIISKRLKANPSVCSNLDVHHNFDANKCLAFVVRTTTVNYKKVRPLNVMCHLDICHKAVRFGCQHEDQCRFAHSTIELKTWRVQRSTGISPEEIVRVAANFYESAERKQKANFAATNTGNRKAGGATRKSLNMKMKFVCGQCWRDGRITEPDRILKYCSAKARHLWNRERQILMVRSLHETKWAQVRPLPHSSKNFPAQYELCTRILERNRCTVPNCTFAHSPEERDMWMYMKSNDLHDMQQMYNMWLSLSTQSQPAEGAAHPPPNMEEKYIMMPTDNMEPSSGFHCRLCGKYSNSERQWQQHISTEKHKDRVFSCEGEEEALTWSYRFPGKQLELCPKLGGHCPDGVSCDFAHSTEELQEWRERRDFLRRKLDRAREELLIMPDEFDFGKYNYLLKS
ncbi:zinc finger CCCH domain-containing protein 7B-like isoform X2 [Synchiropus splendidus]|uniref:zinc finger CCCH domain-containing protein 7B-like isoform X2 n=1 Tax=Synchiropus splendidus TaxID=270530 RepID=UPI00237D7EFF|nr:zinc finger CCCH domain-containing protein 7B-like isoform X2 [Synchiropus splendidus]